MPTRLGFIHSDVFIAYRLITLVDEDGLTDGLPGYDSEPLFVTGADGIGVFLLTGGNDMYADVRVEMWDAPAPESDELWERSEQGLVLLRGDTVNLVQTDSGAVGYEPDPDNAPGYKERLDLHCPTPGWHGVRAYARGWSRARELPEATFQRGVEHWLIQLWPASA